MTEEGEKERRRGSFPFLVGHAQIRDAVGHLVVEHVVVADVTHAAVRGRDLREQRSCDRAKVAPLARELGEDRAAPRDEGVDDHAAVVSVVSVGATAQLSVLRRVAAIRCRRYAI